MSRVPVLIFSLLFALSAARARADAPRDAAKHRKAANSAFELSDYARAIDEFKRAYEVDPDPRLLYNLGLSHMKRFELGGSREDLVQARDYFRRFLALSPTNLKGAERRKVERFRRTAEDHLTKLALLFDERGADATEVKASTATVASVMLAPAIEPEREREREVIAEPVEPIAHAPLEDGSTPVFYIVAGATAAAAMITALLAVQSSSDAYQAASERNYASANERADRARILGVSTDVLLATAIVSATLGLLLD